jgi:acetyl-CoA carboxylase alpha subunit
MKCQSFRSVEIFRDRRALRGVFVTLIEQRIAVIGGTRGIGLAEDYIRRLGEQDNQETRSKIVSLWISTAYPGK